jgi:hypothetical protein
MTVSGGTRSIVARAARGLGTDRIAESRARRYVGAASSWVPEHLVTSAWLEHAPFAFWLVGALRPRTVVELGTASGFSYLVFCQAIRDHGLAARAYAVDTWAGDEHAGLYGEEVYTGLREAHDAAYGGFSTLVRSSFSDALPCFADGSIDLLHVDGLHTYEAVRGDVESWTPKLSDRATVLLHDTNVHAPGFGVQRYWEELRAGHPWFEFLHGNGLGVLVVGTETAPIVLELAGTRRRPRVVEAVRRRYAALGRDVSARLEAGA